MTSERKIKFRCDVLKNGIPFKTLDMVSCRIDCQKDAVIHRTASFVVRSSEGVDLLRDRLRPVMIINDTEHSLGVFLPMSPTKTAATGTRTEQIDAYDVTAILREDSLTERLFIAAGTKYTTAVENIVIGANAGSVEITESDKVLRTDREFDIGTSKLDIINELLSEINYKSAVADVNGKIIIEPYAKPVLSAVNKTYKADEVSKIYPNITESADFYNVPNVFIAVVSNSDLEEDLVSVYTNDNPASKLSTLYRGRKIVSEIYQPDGIASQEDLDAYVAKKAFDAMQIEQTVEITTALMPDHGVGEVIFIEHPEITGAFEEIAWSMELKAGGAMTHTLRRIVNG